MDEKQLELTTQEMLKFIAESQQTYFKSILEEYKTAQRNLLNEYLKKAKASPLLQSDQTHLVDEAFAQAQAQFSKITKDAQGYNYAYVDLAGILNAIREPFANYSLSFSQPLITENGSHYIYSVIRHSSGQWLGSKTLVTIEESNKSMHQDWGTAITYTRKYAAKSLLGLADEDNDGAR